MRVPRLTAVVLAAGRGRRLRDSDGSHLATDAQRQAARAGLKVLMPVGPDDSRPLLDFVLHALAEAGVTDVVLVVPPDHAAIARWLVDRPPRRLRVELAVQAMPTGTAGAVAAGAARVTTARFLVVNGDNIYPVAAIRALAAVESCALAAFTRASLERDSGFTAARAATFAAVQRDAAGWLTGLHEKPPVESLAADALLSLNLWWMDQAMAAACREVPRSPRGEQELPDAAMLAVARGTPVRVIEAAGTVLDLTSAADVAAVSRALDGVEPRP